MTVTTEKVHEVADLTAAKLNAALLELRRLFLVEDLVDSVKFALVLWALTYVGSWFNGLTLVILGNLLCNHLKPNCWSTFSIDVLFMYFDLRRHWSLQPAQSL